VGGKFFVNNFANAANNVGCGGCGSTVPLAASAVTSTTLTLPNANGVTQSCSTCNAGIQDGLSFAIMQFFGGSGTGNGSSWTALNFWNNTVYQIGGSSPTNGCELVNGLFVTGTALTFQDNLLGNCTTSNPPGTGGITTETYDHNTYCAVGSTSDTGTGLQTLATCALFSAPSTNNFALVSDTSAWTPLSSPFNVDILGNTRTSSRGAFQLSSAGGSTAVVQHKLIAQGTTPISGALGGAVTPGNTLIIPATIPTSATVTISDNNGNNYSKSTVFTTTLNSTPYSIVFFCVANPILTPNNPPTITISGGPVNHAVADIREYSNLSCTIDEQIASTTPTSTTSATTQSITTTQTDLLVEAFYDIHHFYSSVGSGWLNSDNNGPPGNVGAIFGDQLNMAAGTYSGAATLSSADAFWFGVIIAYVR
jgi:hypothetical protein